jgi:hypothetical protein
VVPQILEALPHAIDAGLRLPIVYNTSSYDSLDSLALMDGIVGRSPATRWCCGSRCPAPAVSAAIVSGWCSVKIWASGRPHGRRRPGDVLGMCCGG